MNDLELLKQIPLGVPQPSPKGEGSPLEDSTFELKNIEYTNNNITGRFDEQLVMDASIDDLDQKLWERFKTPLSPPDNIEFLEKLRLISRDEDGALHPTVGGILMAAEYPERHISNAYIQVVCYNGENHNSPQLDAQVRKP